MSAPYDLAVIGGGSAGLVGARLAAQLGARVALIEQDRVGGDCTWTGCVPSKALLRAAKAAHEVSHAGRYGIETTPARVDMGRVAASVRGAMETVYRQEDPATLDAEGTSRRVRLRAWSARPARSARPALLDRDRGPARASLDSGSVGRPLPDLSAAVRERNTARASRRAGRRPGRFGDRVGLPAPGR